MRNPNVRIVVIALILVLAVAAIGLFVSFGNSPDTQHRADPQTPAAADNTGAAQAYLRVQVGDQVWEPIALADGDEYTITQPDGKENVVKVTANGAVMHFSTCDNQSCVEQGEVTLDNRDMRVLGNMIICLPHQVTLQLYTVEEMEALIASLEGEAAQ